MSVEGRVYFPSQDEFESACRAVMKNDKIDGDPDSIFMLEPPMLSGRQIRWGIGVNQETGRMTITMRWIR